MEPESAAEPRRRFTLLDAMILVAAIAPGLALSTAVVREWGGAIGRGRPTAIGWDAVRLGTAVVTPVALTLTPGLLLMRLRRPRPPRARLWRSGGALTLATLSVVAPGAAIALWGIIGMSPQFGLRDPEVPLVVMLLMPVAPASAAVAVKTCCALLGIRRHPADWPDRLGRLWGWLWIVIAPINFWSIIS